MTQEQFETTQEQLDNLDLADHSEDDIGGKFDDDGDEEEAGSLAANPVQDAQVSPLMLRGTAKSCVSASVTSIKKTWLQKKNLKYALADAKLPCRRYKDCPEYF